VRIVPDTNVIVSAILWRGPPYRFLEALRRRTDVQVFSSPAILADLVEVLTRPFATGRLELAGMSGSSAVSSFLEIAVLVRPGAVPRVVIADPDDDEILACAVTANADLIVSGDRHLLDLLNHGGIPIVTPAKALTLLESGTRAP
jgi:putative PIN family toxin of toxin-antitoxin system